MSAHPPALRPPAPDMKGVRWLPMVGDSMEPRIRSRDLVAVLPIDRVGHNGLYVIDQGLGAPAVVRLSQTNEGWHVGYDNPRCLGGPCTRERVDAMVVGIVIGVFAWTN